MQKNINPSWWGTSIWQTIYFITAVYPENPSNEKIESIRGFFKGLRHLLPCEHCQESYKKFSSEYDTNIDNLENFRSRNNLILFVYNLRNKVNGKLANDYYINLNYFKKKMDYIITSDSNIYDGKICDLIEVPFIPKELEKKVFNYLKSQTDYDIVYTKKILEISKKFMENPIFDYNNKTFRFIFKRNKKCRKIIKKIHNRMSEGKYDLVESFLNKDRNLHNILLFLGCSILHKDNLNDVMDIVLKK